MISSNKITGNFYVIDEFCKEFENVTHKHRLVEDTGIKARRRTSTLSDSEVMAIMVLFHYKQFRNLKHFYLYYVRVHMKNEFPKTVSYNRFVELQQKPVLPSALFLKTRCSGGCTGISFIDSTPLRVCHNKREKQHKVFKGIAAKGQCSLGRFFGFKLHLIINDKGEILDFMLAQGNVDDRKPLRTTTSINVFLVKYMGIKVTSARIMLRKRALIETVNDELKNQCQVEHTRHRSFENFITNLLSGSVSYSFFDKKPTLNLEIIDKRLTA